MFNRSLIFYRSLEYENLLCADSSVVLKREYKKKIKKRILDFKYMNLKILKFDSVYDYLPRGYFVKINKIKVPLKFHVKLLISFLF